MATEHFPDGEVPTEGIHRLLYIAEKLYEAGLIGPTGFLGLELRGIDWDYFNNHPIFLIRFYPHNFELVCFTKANSRIFYGRERRRIDLPEVMFIFQDGIRANTELNPEDQSIIADYIRRFLSTYAWLCVKRMGKRLGPCQRRHITALEEFWETQHEADES